MANRYEINQLEKQESWRMFRIIGEFVDGFDTLPRYLPAVTVYGSARIAEGSPYAHVARELGLTPVPVPFAVSLIVFSMIHLIPGDPIHIIAGEMMLPEETRDALRRPLGID